VKDQLVANASKPEISIYTLTLRILTLTQTIKPVILNYQ